MPAGFTRIKYLGLRPNDRARMCYIEMIGNPIEIFEANEKANQKESLGLQSFWSWEHKILKQEQEYFQNLIQNLDASIQLELDQVLTTSASSPGSDEFNSHLKKDIEAKYAKKRLTLEAGLRRAQFEETIHLKQEKYNRYERLTENYMFPLKQFVVDDTIKRNAPRITV